MDIYFLLITIVFFGVTAGLVLFCDKLRGA
jgi:hypothetical protein